MVAIPVNRQSSGSHAALSTRSRPRIAVTTPRHRPSLCTDQELARDIYLTIQLSGAHEIGTYANEQLASGVNLRLLKTPMSEQAMKVYQLATPHVDLHRDRWRHVQVPLADDNPSDLEQTLLKLNSLEQYVIDKERKAALPKQHSFAITPVLRDDWNISGRLHANNPRLPTSHKLSGHSPGVGRSCSFVTTADERPSCSASLRSFLCPIRCA